MAALSVTDVALEGFRVTRERPQTLLVWAVVYLIVSLVMSVFLITNFGSALTELQAAGTTGIEPEPETLARVLGPFYLVMVPIGLIVMAVWMAAVYRVVLRPEDQGLGHMKLGADELRLALLMLIYVLLWMVFAFVVILAAGLLTAGAAVAGEAAGAMAGIVIGLGAVALFIFVAVRLSLAGAQTFAEQRLRVFGSWRLTKGHFWPLLGAYVLALILTILVVLLGLVIYAAVAAVMAGGDLARVSQVFQPDMTSLAVYFTPAMILYSVFAAFLGAVQNAIIYAPGAAAYRALTQG